MKLPRSSGILLHPTSLPGAFGIGDLGPEAFRFADFLAEAKQGIWQMLPLGPTGYGDSPYQCFSAFAGNPTLVSLARLCDEGLLHKEDFSSVPPFSADSVEYERVDEFKEAKLQQAFVEFQKDGSVARRSQFEEFKEA